MLISAARNLKKTCGHRVDTRAVIAKCAAGLLIVSGIAALALGASIEDRSVPSAALTVQQASNDR
jgi:hypothetical protein